MVRIATGLWPAYGSIGHPHPFAAITRGGLEKERRPGSGLPGIQMLRGVAALAAVVHHMLEHSNGTTGRSSPDWLTTRGASGVDISFVIGGFIMLHVSFRPDRAATRPSEFPFRRATRIYPIYWLCRLAMLHLTAMRFPASLRIDMAMVLTPFLLLPGTS